jgi:NAD(P)-dependent dehydrogenase (short-subunit alcohol dehydrogenase family)
MRLLGKVAFITGGNSGIGLATARRLIREGAKVTIVGRSQETLREAAATLGTNLLPLRSDLAVPVPPEVALPCHGLHRTGPAA